MLTGQYTDLLDRQLASQSEFFTEQLARVQRLQEEKVPPSSLATYLLLMPSPFLAYVC